MGGGFSKVRLKDSLFIIDEDIDIHSVKDQWKQFGLFVDVFPLDRTHSGRLPFKRIRQKYASVLTAYIHYSINGKGFSPHIALIAPFLKPFDNDRLIRVRDSLLRGKGDYLISWEGVYNLEHKLFDNDWFSVQTSLPFEGKQYPAPMEYQKVLTTIYGSDYMELPPEDKRINHEPRYLRIGVFEVVNQE